MIVFKLEELYTDPFRIIVSFQPNSGASSGKCCYLIKNTQQAIISKQVNRNIVVRNMYNEVKVRKGSPLPE
jgi:hypothetical protein